MMNIFATSIARAGGIETEAGLRIVPAPRPVADHTAVLLSGLARMATFAASRLDRGARQLKARRRPATGVC
ncbi:MAG: hypothetical protein GY791_03965 [Alphaproteobacteria bacterium]|nr:hypothetical protein [Alphaproteobacteria bacterium]